MFYAHSSFHFDAVRSKRAKIAAVKKVMRYQTPTIMCVWNEEYSMYIHTHTNLDYPNPPRNALGNDGKVDLNKNVIVCFLQPNKIVL